MNGLIKSFWCVYVADEILGSSQAQASVQSNTSKLSQASLHVACNSLRNNIYNKSNTIHMCTSWRNEGCNTLTPYTKRQSRQAYKRPCFASPWRDRCEHEHHTPNNFPHPARQSSHPPPPLQGGVKASMTRPFQTAKVEGKGLPRA